jgi:hypothetical protein
MAYWSCRMFRKLDEQSGHLRDATFEIGKRLFLVGSNGSREGRLLEELLGNFSDWEPPRRIDGVDSLE